MRKTTLTIIFLVLISAVSGQTILSYDWKEKPERMQLSEQELNEPQVTLKMYHEMEYFYSYEARSIGKLDLVHKIIRLNNDEGIDNNNKIYLPTNNLTDLKVYKARIIYEDGKTRELEKEDIKEVKDKYGRVKVLYYAIEGVKKGVDLEVIYGRLYLDNLSGERVTVQNEYTIKNAEYIIKVPKYLDLRFKSYNGLEEFKEEKEGGHNIYTLKLDRVEPLEKEKFSNYSTNQKSFLYKLTKNNNSGASLYQYVDRNEDLYNSYYDNNVKKKVILNFIEEMKISSLKEEEKVIEIEKYIKTNIDILNDASGDIKTILKEKKASYYGIIRLYAEIFEVLEIKHKLINTSDRIEKGTFDEEYESYYYLEDLLFYFNSTKKLLNPVDFTGRYPYVEPGFLANKGLFFSLIKVGDITSLIYKVDKIETLSSEFNYQNFKATVDLSNLEKLKMDLVIENFGYLGSEDQAYYRFYTEEDHEKSAYESLKVMDEDAVVENYKISNSTSNDIGVKPYTIEGTLSSDKLMEVAGNNYLFKIGKIIGAQKNLYNKEERVSNIELPYLYTLNKTITFKIPEGYEIKNLDKLNLFATDSLKTLSFKSSYTINENEVTVSLEERYNKISYNKSYYSEFRKVINTSADFNKVTLVLEKI